MSPDEWQADLAKLKPVDPHAGLNRLDIKPAFEVMNRDESGNWHTFKIYADGRIEGFPEGSIVINRIPNLVAGVKR